MKVKYIGQPDIMRSCQSSGPNVAFWPCFFERRYKLIRGRQTGAPDPKTDSSALTDPVRWVLDVGPFATGAATRASEALPVLKNISTHQTPGRADIELSPLNRYGAGNMRKMLINLFFPDSHGLGELSGAHLLFTQEDDHPLTNRFHATPMFFLPHVRVCSRGIRSFREVPGFVIPSPISFLRTAPRL